jgi:hypothetical protein
MTTPVAARLHEYRVNSIYFNSTAIRSRKDSVIGRMPTMVISALSADFVDVNGWCTGPRNRKTTPREKHVMKSYDAVRRVDCLMVLRSLLLRSRIKDKSETGNKPCSRVPVLTAVTVLRDPRTGGSSHGN